MLAADGQSHAFQADVARLLDLMVHSVYSDRDIFLRELVSNGADACEKLRYEALADPSLTERDANFLITVSLDKEARTLTVGDNGIGMSKEDLTQSLGTIARSGTRAFLDSLEGRAKDDSSIGRDLIGQFGIGFYSAFMVAEKIDVETRRAGANEAYLWSSDGKGTFSIAPLSLEAAPPRGTQSHSPSAGERERISRTCSGRADPAGAFERDRSAHRHHRCAGPGTAPLDRRVGPLDEAEERDQQGGLRRVLSQSLRPVRRTRAHPALARRRQT